jgi:hypothetical protein
MDAADMRIGENRPDEPRLRILALPGLGPPLSILRGDCIGLPLSTLRGDSIGDRGDSIGLFCNEATFMFAVLAWLKEIFSVIESPRHSGGSYPGICDMSCRYVLLDFSSPTS